MSLLKAFVCQVILLGTYKLFLEHIFEDYLVPDELTRNCLVGFVCLLCFGIQLYTDKAADDDNDEAGEDLKAASNSREVASTTKKCESAKISLTQEIVTETIRSNTSSQVTITKTQTTTPGSGEFSFSSSKDQRVADSKERISAIPTFETKKAIPVTNSGIFAQCSTNMSSTLPNVETNEPEVSASNVQTSYNQEMITISESNGLSATNDCEESEEDEIEIDQFETKESVTEGEPLVSTQVEVEPYVPEPATDIVEESECMLSNGENLPSIQNLETTTLKTNETEVEMTNGAVEESLNNNSISAGIIEETESKKSVIDENEIGNRQEIPVVPKSNESTKDVTDSLPSTEEVKNTSSVLTKAINAPEITNKTNTETSTLVNAAVPSTLSKIKASGDVFVAPLTIDISFIYACH